MKKSWNVVVLDFLAVDNFDFTRKIVKKFFGWKTRENVLSKLHFWTKIKTYRIVCERRLDTSSQDISSELVKSSSATSLLMKIVFFQAKYQSQSLLWHAFSAEKESAKYSTLTCGDTIIIYLIIHPELTRKKISLFVVCLTKDRLK